MIQEENDSRKNCCEIDLYTVDAFSSAKIQYLQLQLYSGKILCIHD